MDQIPERINIALDMIKDRKGQIIKYLDIGCADGRITKLLSKYIGAEEVYGIDISNSLLRSARLKGIRVLNLDVDKESLPFRSNYFDLVTVFEVIEHLFDPDFVLQEIYRVLKSRGLLLISTPNLSYWLNRFLFVFGYKPYGMELSTKYVIGEPRKLKKSKMAGHIRVFNFKSLRQILQIYGFKVIKAKGVPVTTQNFMTKFIDRAFISISPSFAQTIVMLSEKR